MKGIVFTVIIGLMLFQQCFAQTLEQDINRKIKPPLELHQIAQQLADLEKQLIAANKEVDFWKNAHFYNDKKRERERMEKLIYWDQKTVQIRNQMTKLQQDRSYYQHKYYGDERFYYKK